jgi:hypothetical protein
MSEVRAQFATPSYPTIPTNPSRPSSCYSPSTPTTSTSTRETSTVDVDGCTRCNRPMLRANRRAARAAGIREHVAHGLCSACWQRQRPQVAGRSTNHGARLAAPDEIAVLRAVFGESLPLSATERHAAVHACRARGLSIAETARRLGLSSRNVARWRAVPLERAS